MAEVAEYRSRDTVFAIKLEDFPSIPAVNNFVGLPTAVEFNPDGSFRMRVIRGNFDVIVIKQGECVYKTADGTLKVCTEQWLQEKFEKVVA
ncbi:hypothetical protein J2Z32_003478 [Paenibacillus turicensis]|uniref:Uncharacterized protein n=1 Tax=Paenibacillus turicensis TaxID=160487 RepID=A0ABS4FW67_9BACL|nr:hypothetical protein [Paenibacillus turicensis]MBP1906814.1 hypothetical protein [Paenibacillus turicensis]